MYQVNNSGIFNGKPIGYEEYLTGWLRLQGKLNHRKNRMCCPILIKKIEGKEEK